MEVLYKNQAKTEPLRVYFDNSGEEDVVIEKGTGLSYDYAWEGTLIDDTEITAASVFPGRCQIVKLPESGDKGFAGVSRFDYTVPAGKSKWILIDQPGSVVSVRTLVSCTAGVTGLAYSYDATNPGIFKAIGTAVGKGTAYAMQTLDPDGTETLVQVVLEEGQTSSPVA